MKRNIGQLIRLELLQLFRDRAFVGLMFLLFVLMCIATFNPFMYQSAKKQEIVRQQEIVQEADEQLAAQIDSLNRGLATYENSYTLPTNGVRLTYNNHRITWLPFKPLSIISNGQGDIYSNYKKIVLYFDESYEMATKELISPLEQHFGLLDLSFIWVYLLPLIIILVSFNILSEEKESGRLSLIASQPIKLSQWILARLSVRFLVIILSLILFTVVLLTLFQVSVFRNIEVFAQLILLLILYAAFWFSLGFLINLLGYSSGKSLILLTNIWVLFVFLTPSIVNQLGEEINPVSSRLAIINHHQTMYNEMENNLEEELKGLYEMHPDWSSDDPVTKDLSNSTGWNINYLAKQYIAQIKHRPVAVAYEQQIDARNEWLRRFRSLSPSMTVQESLSDLAGTSTRYYRSYLRQAIEYAQKYRWYVFQGLFTNHSFTSNEIKSLPVFKFDSKQIPSTFLFDCAILMTYLVLVVGVGVCLLMIRKNFHHNTLEKQMN